MKKIGAVIVAFNPKVEMIDNMTLILKQVDYIVLIDNSENNESLIEFKDFLNEDKNIFVIKNNENLGMSRALNQGCLYLQEKNCSHALLMDQDSIVSNNMVEVLYGYAKKNENTGIVGPLIIPKGIEYNLIKDNLRFVQKKSTFLFSRVRAGASPFKVAFNITSGSLCNLCIWEKLGGFLEELFIDGVDNEYGLRLMTNGYDTVIHPGTVLYQMYGNQKKVKFFGRCYFPTCHGYRRRYYASRNRILIWNRYFFKQPFYIMWDFLSFINLLKMIILFEDNKLNKLYFIALGIRDGLVKRSGKFQ